MSRFLKLVTGSYIFAAALAFAPSAFATTHNGEGIYGPTTDTTIMDAMFLIMGVIILIIIVFSLLQSWLERRHYAKMDGGGHSHGSH